MLKAAAARSLKIAVMLVSICLIGPASAWGHCDTMDGPVVADAKAALEKNDVTPVLKWVQKDKEDEIRTAFQKTMAVRAKGAEAKELADMYFFETLVRIHRQGEGAPYTGLKPVGTPVETGLAESDKALEAGNVDQVVKAATDAVADGIRQRFAKATQAKKHAGESVEAGRDYVAAYVEFIHYVERIFADAKSSAHSHGQEAHAAQPAPHHEEPTKAPAQESEHRH